MPVKATCPVGPEHRRDAGIIAIRTFTLLGFRQFYVESWWYVLHTSTPSDRNRLPVSSRGHVESRRGSRMDRVSGMGSATPFGNAVTPTAFGPLSCAYRYVSCFGRKLH
jgi:hypothetical protein